MCATYQKQIGDLVTITGGANKGQQGILQEKVSKGRSIKLRNGEVVFTLFPFVKLIAKKGEFEDTQQTEQLQENEGSQVDADIPANIEKLTILQLRELAKQKGVLIQAVNTPKGHYNLCVSNSHFLI